MKIVITVLVCVGAWIALTHVAHAVYASHINVPGIELSENAFRALGTACATLLAWARIQ